MGQLIHCIYASKASPAFQEDTLPDLLESARRNNAARDITGMLLYVEGNFFQVLEGMEASVTEVFDSIRSDPRHGRVTRIIAEPIFERAFAEWTMGFANIGFAKVKASIGANDFFNSATCLEQLTPGRARKLLDAFRQGRWRADRTGTHRALSRLA
ncbi:MAG: BLUF domain-containing protein [Pseudomonadota bacterium]